MKTLNEVIKAYEICLNINETSCLDCPYTEFNAEGKWACSLCGDCTEDALHYLKTYRENQHAYEEGNRKAEEARERYMEAVKNCERAENIYKQKQKAAEDALWIYKEDKDDLTALRAYRKEQHENNPLTWDELQRMEGKPIWVEYIKGGKRVDAEWIVIKKVKSTCIENTSGRFQVDSLGWAWQAYRKERE